MTRTPHILIALGVSMFLTIGCKSNPQTMGHYIDDTAITPPTTLAADAAYAEAGIGPSDVDVAECQDATTDVRSVLRIPSFCRSHPDRGR